MTWLLGRALAGYALWRVFGDVRAARRLVRGFGAGTTIRLTIKMHHTEGERWSFELPRGFALAGKIMEQRGGYR